MWSQSLSFPVVVAHHQTASQPALLLIGELRDTDSRIGRDVRYWQPGLINPVNMRIFHF